MGTEHSDLFYCGGTLAGWAGGSRSRGSPRRGGMASLTHAVLSTARQCHQSAGRDWYEGTHRCPLLGYRVWMARVDVPRPPAHVQGEPAWPGGKPSAGRSSPPPALGVCPHPINAAPAPGLILVLGAVGGHWLGLSSPVIFPSRLMGVYGHSRE